MAGVRCVCGHGCTPPHIRTVNDGARGGEHELQQSVGEEVVAGGVEAGSGLAHEELAVLDEERHGHEGHQEGLQLFVGWIDRWGWVGELAGGMENGVGCRPLVNGQTALRHSIHQPIISFQIRACVTKRQMRREMLWTMRGCLLGVRKKTTPWNTCHHITIGWLRIAKASEDRGGFNNQKPLFAHTQHTKRQSKAKVPANAPRPSAR